MKQCPGLPDHRYEVYNRPSKRRREQSDLLGYVSSTRTEEAAELDALFAEAIYTSGIPFSFVSISHIV